MTSDPKKDRLGSIDEFVISEILSMSETEILSEVPDAGIEEAQRRLEQVKLAAGRQRFEEIRAEIERESASGGVVSFDRAKARAELKNIIANDSELRGKLTMAARNLDGNVDDDVEGILEDLAELDADAGNPDDETK
jgi:hypothetical protein